MMLPSTLSSSSSAGPLIVRAAISAQSTPSHGIHPVFTILICIAVLTISLLSLCLRRKLASMGEVQPIQPVSVHVPFARRVRTNEDGPTRRPPEMIDAWTERCSTSKCLKWKEYTPFSATILANTEAKRPVRKGGKLWGGGARGKKDKGSCHLQVGVLVAMPSQLHTKTRGGVAQEPSASPIRDGLAIGLIETWVDGPLMLKKTAS